MPKSTHPLHVYPPLPYPCAFASTRQSHPPLPASSCCPPSLPTYISQTPNISKVLRATSTHP
eukprot:26548-Hanusia_phi.AAC.1